MYKWWNTSAHWHLYLSRSLDRHQLRSAHLFQWRHIGFERVQMRLWLLRHSLPNVSVNQVAVNASIFKQQCRTSVTALAPTTTTAPTTTPSTVTTTTTTTTTATTTTVSTTKNTGKNCNGILCNAIQFWSTLDVCRFDRHTYDRTHNNAGSYNHTNTFDAGQRYVRHAVVVRCVRGRFGKQ